MHIMTVSSGHSKPPTKPGKQAAASPPMMAVSPDPLVGHHTQQRGTKSPAMLVDPRDTAFLPSCTGGLDCPFSRAYLHQAHQTEAVLSATKAGAW